MANKRITDQTTDTALTAGDYIIVDSSTEGTRKYDIGTKLGSIDTNMGDLTNLTTTAKNNLVAAINEAAQSGGGGGGTPYTSNPEALGTASPGSSSDYSRGDHVHPMPSASDVGAIATPSTSPTTGQFLKWSGTAWVASDLPVYSGGVS